MIDQLIQAFDTGLRTVAAPANSTRPRPDAVLDAHDKTLNAAEKKHAASLMRVNHVGEICAQALYSGQALTCKNPTITKTLKHAAQEEVDHLSWCETRIQELGGRKSLLNPLWYLGSFSIGVTAGMMGERKNLGFLAETEKQVGAHLASHLNKLPIKDTKTRAIVAQMQQDELEHAHTAEDLGSDALPQAIKAGMKLASKVMTTVSYRI